MKWSTVLATILNCSGVKIQKSKIFSSRNRFLKHMTFEYKQETRDRRDDSRVNIFGKFIETV